jgi:hypothetical protein
MAVPRAKARTMRPASTPKIANKMVRTMPVRPSKTLIALRSRDK